MGYKTDIKFVKNCTIQLLYNNCTKINIWLQYSALSYDIYSILSITAKITKEKPGNPHKCWIPGLIIFLIKFY